MHKTADCNISYKKNEFQTNFKNEKKYEEVSLFLGKYFNCFKVNFKVAFSI